MSTAYGVFNDAVNAAFISNIWREGPYAYGGNYYLFTSYLPLGVGNGYVRVFKSAALQTWAALDTANEPLATYVNGGHGIDTCRVSNVIHVCYLDAVGNYALTTFNLATETWGAKITGGPTQNVFEASKFNPGLLAVLSSGDRIIGYHLASGGTPTESRYVVYNGAWQAPVTINNASRLLMSIAQDNSDRVHFLTYNNGDRTYRDYVLAAGVLAAPVSVFTTNNASTFCGKVAYNSGTDTILFSFTQVNVNIEVIVAEGTPSAAPVYTTTVLGDSGPILNFVFSACIVGSTLQFVVVIREDETLVYFKKTAGVWGAETQYWTLTDGSSPAGSILGTYRPAVGLASSGNDFVAGVGLDEGSLGYGQFFYTIVASAPFVRCVNKSLLSGEPGHAPPSTE